MRRPANSLLIALLLTAIVVTAALGLAGWRLLNQEGALEATRAHDQAESRADLAAAGIRGKLAESGERLSSWLSNPTSDLPSIEGGVVVGVRPDAVLVNPHGGLPFVPVTVPPPDLSAAFAGSEAMEFSGDLNGAARVYRDLGGHPEVRVRAGALLRLARVQRKRGELRGALATYKELAQLGSISTEELPAELAGLSGQRSTYLAMADREHAAETARQIRQGIDDGRWMIRRGAAELYRDAPDDVLTESWVRAAALSELWRSDGVLTPRGQRIVDSGDATHAKILVQWRSNGVSTAALAASVDRFFDVTAAPAGTWQLIDPDGHVIWGSATAPPNAVTRIIGNAEYPWTLRMWPLPAVSPTSSRTLMTTMMVATLTFVWGAAYFMARAIRREAAVARLQTDFVSAVSHEFRSPLTAVKQMAEMLSEDRVPTEERRQKYYRLLAAEATRLQRLVETLLNFGRMEAGAETYRFAELEMSELIRQVVDDIAPQARESGKAIEVDGPPAPTRVRADHEALSIALRNLLDNAIKYSPGQPTVWVRWHKDDHCAAICVVDRGVGIPRAEQRSIFGKFVRGRAAVDSRIRGTGVGLSMVRQIIAAHGGDVQLESEPGRGSTFTLRIPAAN